MSQTDINLEADAVAASLGERLSVFHGDANPASARIYAQLDLSPGESAQGFRLVGKLSGPNCAFSHTLPARIAMQNRSEGRRLLLEAIVPDPCFWTPELPFLYRTDVQLFRGDRAAAETSRMVGIRRFAPRGRSFYFDGKRFVLRAVCGDWTEKCTIEAFGQIAETARETWTALVVGCPTEQTCELASQRGVLLFADLTSPSGQPSPQLGAELVRLSRWPAVALVLIGAATDLASDVRKLTPNLQLIADMESNHQTAPPDWAAAIKVDLVQPAALAELANRSKVPVVVARKCGSVTNVENARSECDRLQRELAPYCDLAGYLA